MIPTLSIGDINAILNAKYRGEHRIIGIMLARYDISLVKDVIAECYSYWHENSGRGFDLFWPGYGKHYVDDLIPYRIPLSLPKNANGIFFDSRTFIECKDALNKYLKLPYRDKFELLLVNYNVDHIEFDKHIRIDLEKNLDPYFGSIREIMEFIISQCKIEYDVSSLRNKKIFYDFKKSIKGISVSDAVNIGVNIAQHL